MHWESYHRLAQVWRSLRQGGKQLDPTTQADYDEIIAMDTTLTQTLRDLEFTVLKVNAWTSLAVSSFHHRFHPGRRRVTNPTRSPVDAATPQVTPPQLQATAPYETLVWDITFLPGLHRGQSYALHCVLDLYSRAIVGWQIDTSPNADVAATLFRQIGTDADTAGFTISTIHSDNGRTMKSQAMKKTCRDIGATRS